MFGLVSGIYESYFALPQLNLLIVGASGSGKTTFLERSKVTHFNHKAQSYSADSNRGPVTPPPQPPLHLFLGRDAAAAQAEEQPAAETAAPEAAIMTNNTTGGGGGGGGGSSRQESSAASETSKWTNGGTTVMTTKRRFKSRCACPTSKRYSNARQDDDDEDEEIADLISKEVSPGDKSESLSLSLVKKQQTRTPGPRRSTVESMESVELSGMNDKDGDTVITEAESAADASAQQPDTNTGATTVTMTVQNHYQTEQDKYEIEVDLKPKAKMLPLAKIRPTIGMNLAKVEICGAKCHVWDLGGRLHDLWSRYYNDCDAVIYVWKIDLSEEEEGGPEQEEDSDSDSDDGRPPVSPDQQRRLLEEVRNSIPDDVPFLVMGHAFRAPRAEPSFRYGTFYSTNQLLPYYHNPYQAVTFCNARTGHGCRAAMEWLIPLAKRQQKLRFAQQMQELQVDDK